MPKETKITCDLCLRDLTTTGASPDYRLKLNAEKLPHDFGEAGGGIVYSVLVYPPISKDAYFCAIPCLRQWIKNNWLEIKE